MHHKIIHIILNFKPLINFLTIDFWVWGSANQIVLLTSMFKFESASKWQKTYSDTKGISLQRLCYFGLIVSEKKMLKYENAVVNGWKLMTWSLSFWLIDCLLHSVLWRIFYAYSGRAQVQQISKIFRNEARMWQPFQRLLTATGKESIESMVGTKNLAFCSNEPTGTLFRNLQKWSECAGSVAHVVHNGPQSDLMYYNLITAQSLNQEGAPYLQPGAVLCSSVGRALWTFTSIHWCFGPDELIKVLWVEPCVKYMIPSIIVFK